MFDDIPENREESYPCVYCIGGNITKIYGIWQCDKCPASYEPDESILDKKDG